ncbi:hypothetical protein QFZ20_000866 [Flavobacterium sp. W4I14]|nr:hypothetical protein [Flavobacterium sp. W4I14]
MAQLDGNSKAVKMLINMICKITSMVAKSKGGQKDTAQSEAAYSEGLLHVHFRKIIVIVTKRKIVISIR